MRDYYAYIIVALLSGVVSNIVTAIVVDKLYPQYKAMGKLPKEDVQIINKRIKDLFTSKIGSVVYDSADTLVISAFLGLTALAKYQNYFFVMNTIFGFVTLITSSSLAGIGNSLVTESEEKNYKDLRKFTFIPVLAVGFLYLLFCLSVSAVYDPLGAWAELAALRYGADPLCLLHHSPDQ